MADSSDRLSLPCRLLTAFGAIFGFWGLLIGLPVLIVAQTWLEETVVHDSFKLLAEALELHQYQTSER